MSLKLLNGDHGDINKRADREVMDRKISEHLTRRCTAEEAMQMRAIRNDSGSQVRADEPPLDTGAYTSNHYPDE